MDEIADITAIPSLISDVVTPSDHPTTSFSTTWDSNDALSFQPANLPLRRIRRAWERQPKSPHTRKGHVRKVWKRYELPSRASVIATGGDAISNVSALHKLKSEAGRRSSLETPSKITKKMCLGTAFGQKAKAQEWERRRTSPRRKLSRTENILKAAPTLDLSTIQLPELDPLPNSGTDQLSEEVQDGEVSAEEWSDIASDEELEVLDSIDFADSEDKLFSAPPRDECTPFRSELSPDRLLQRERDESLSVTTQVTLEADETRSALLFTSHPPLLESLSIVPDTNAPAINRAADVLRTGPGEQSMPDSRSTSEPAALSSPSSILVSPISSSGSLHPALMLLPSPHAATSVAYRSTSAPPEEAPSAMRRRSNAARPRISDDTAFLQAFLSRTDASKATRSASVARRASLSNRRDSDAVRQALASPARLGILTDLDVNSPSLQKALLVDEEIEDDTGVQLDNLAATEQPALHTTRKIRKSVRSKSRIPQFPALAGLQGPPPANSLATAAPNKVSVRRGTGPAGLKRSEAQELALMTRNNTRKNKGGSVMPLLRLPKLAAEAISSSPEELVEQVLELAESVRSVRWDETLVYFREIPNDSESTESSLSEPESQPMACQELPFVTKKVEITATRLRLRRPRNSCDTTPAKKLPEPITDTGIDIATAEAKQAPPEHIKKRPRIAATAKSLLPYTAVPNLGPAAHVTTEVQASSKPARAPRKLLTPRKLNLVSLAPNTLGDSKENLSQLGTPKKSVITGIRGFAPRLQLPTPAKDEMPGLASPAKKRGRGMQSAADNSTAQKDKNREQGVPGLASPAKKRVRGKV
ncbi:hypothetical protein LTR50_004725 [Elasticomyces elasticus]|nr:hypothetical protein LTR50_004725 [Elasticomyces elasticus]